MENRLPTLRQVLSCLLALPLLLALASCVTTPSGGGGGSATLHAVHTKQLKKVMNDISDVAVDRLPQEIAQSSGGGSPDLQKVARAAGELNRSASRIPSSVDNVMLEPAEKEVFLTLARRLKSQSAKLQSYARQGDLSNARLSMRQMSSTCNSCHSLFRDNSSPISLFR